MTSKKLEKVASENDAQKQKNKQIRLRKVLTVVLTIIMVMAVCIAPAFASTITDLETGVKSGLGQVYKLITVIVVPVAVVCLAIAAFNVFFNGSKGMEVAKKIGLAVGIGLAVVYLAPLLVTTVKGWFDNIGDQGVFG